MEVTKPNWTKLTNKPSKYLCCIFDSLPFAVSDAFFFIFGFICFSLKFKFERNKNKTWAAATQLR